jgi:hypothetical protein
MPFLLPDGNSKKTHINDDKTLFNEVNGRLCYFEDRLRNKQTLMGAYGDK